MLNCPHRVYWRLLELAVMDMRSAHLDVGMRGGSAVVLWIGGSATVPQPNSRVSVVCYPPFTFLQSQSCRVP